MLFIHIEQYPSIHDDGHDSIRVSHVAYICMSFSLTACPTKNGQYEYLYMVCRAKCDGTDKRQMHFYFMVTRISMNLNCYCMALAIWPYGLKLIRFRHVPNICTLYIVQCTRFLCSPDVKSLSSQLRLKYECNIQTTFWYEKKTISNRVMGKRFDAKHKCTKTYLTPSLLCVYVSCTEVICVGGGCIFQSIDEMNSSGIVSVVCEQFHYNLHLMLFSDTFISVSCITSHDASNPIQSKSIFSVFFFLSFSFCFVRPLKLGLSVRWHHIHT